MRAPRHPLRGSPLSTLHRAAPALLPGGALLLAGALFLSAPPSLLAQERPAGWEVRPDGAAHLHHGADPQGLEFVDMPPGWHITTGPAVILWQTGTTASGDFRVEVDLHLFDPGGRRESFGVFMGGRNLHEADQGYTYFLIRDGGQYLIRKRVGEEVPIVVNWTTHPAIRSWADRGDAASVLNTLAVETRGNRVHFLVNGEEVTAVPRAGLDTDGIVGLRVNHSLNLHVSRLEVGAPR